MLRTMPVREREIKYTLHEEERDKYIPSVRAGALSNFSFLFSSASELTLYPFLHAFVCLLIRVYSVFQKK